MLILALLLCTVSGWVTGYQTTDNLWNTLTSWGGVQVHFTFINNVLNIFSTIQYINIIIPVGIANFVETIENVESASLSGDEFDVGFTMVIDGLGTLVGSSFGSGFPTTVYIGHYAYKKMGASIGYSL